MCHVNWKTIFQVGDFALFGVVVSTALFQWSEQVLHPLYAFENEAALVLRCYWSPC